MEIKKYLMQILVLILQQNKKNMIQPKLLDEDIEGGREERTFRMWINSLVLPHVFINNVYEEYKTGLLKL